ncbi:MarR family winged helix-turn-helix transcriptional regulator [uncultured Secundilactobacillus sp.]|uniref:MarR family winged helix-turn-helix transcriptional regulator n=1 Tax=uncultured Secundilactobacillus sp. TaxID=2813935 RepID=UPI00258AF7A1|nr:MarR family winged helix-turn-helix transcriptional regulator [uncultured Secundilactobacillus sp.]
MATVNTGRLLRRASNQLVHQFDRFAATYGLTSMQMSIIDFLSRNSEKQLIQRDIEREFNVQRSTMTMILQRMEKKALIQRVSVPQDARQKQVILTAKATNLAHDIRVYMTRQNAEVEARFGASQMQAFNQILDYYTALTNEDFTTD